MTLDVKAESKGAFIAPSKAGRHRLKLYLMCDSYLGCDQEHEVDYAVEGEEDAEDGAAAAGGDMETD